MSRSSPPIQPNNNQNKKRLPLSDALKKGAIALHNFELSERGNDNRESSFKTKTGVSYGVTTKGGKQERIFIYIVYAKDEEGREIVVGELVQAAKGKIPIHVGKIQGAFWLIASLPKKLYKEVVGNWGMFLKKAIKVAIYLFLLAYVLLHPELKDFVMKIIESPLFPPL